MTDQVDGVEVRGGSEDQTLRMEALHIHEKLDRTPLNSTGTDNNII